MALQALVDLPADQKIEIGSNGYLMASSVPDSYTFETYLRLTEVSDHYLKNYLSDNWELQGGEMTTLIGRIDKLENELWMVERWIYILAAWVIHGTDLTELRSELTRLAINSPSFAESAYFLIKDFRRDDGESFFIAKEAIDALYWTSCGDKLEEIKALKLAYHAGMLFLDELENDPQQDRLDLILQSNDKIKALMQFPEMYRVVRSGFIGTPSEITDRPTFIQGMVRCYNLNEPSKEKDWREAYNAFYDRLFALIDRDDLIAREGRFEPWLVRDDVGIPFHQAVNGNIDEQRTRVLTPGLVPYEE